MCEKDLQRLVTDALDLFRWKWAHFRPAQTSRGWRTPVSGPIGAGWPDLVAVRGVRVLFLELKAQAATVSPLQAAVHDVLHSAGLDVRVVRPADIDSLLEDLR
jgi:hypothetical protein